MPLELGERRTSWSLRPEECEAAPCFADYAAYSETRPASLGCGGGDPLVSAVTVTMNAAKTVEKTISSIHNQTYRLIEHVVVDGGSTDGTIDLLKARLRTTDCWISESDRGISDAFNKGIALARGTYVQIINADDWLSSDQISRAVKALSSADVDFVFGDCIFHEGGEPTYRYRGDPGYAASIKKRMPAMNHPSMLVRRDAYGRFGLYSRAYRNAMDYEWLVRAHKRGARGAYDARIVAHMNVDGVSNRLFGRTAREVREASVAHGRNRVAAEFEYRYQISKIWLSQPIKKSCRPLYNAIRSTINLAYQPLR
jgi:glycosyltransferase involved in cell wall biosynthesis